MYKRQFLILFHDERGNAKIQNKIVNAISKTKTKKDEKDLRIQQLEHELALTREDMRGITDDQEAVNEELQSANEELLSGSEELQSLNEELQTVNIELKRKINEYAHAHDDMKNQLNSIEIATLFLDKDLNIRRFTDKLSNIIKLRITDVGRPFTDLVTELQYPEILPFP